MLTQSAFAAGGWEGVGTVPSSSAGWDPLSGLRRVGGALRRSQGRIVPKAMVRGKGHGVNRLSSALDCAQAALLKSMGFHGI